MTTSASPDPTSPPTRSALRESCSGRARSTLGVLPSLRELKRNKIEVPQNVPKVTNKKEDKKLIEKLENISVSFHNLYLQRDLEYAVIEERESEYYGSALSNTNGLFKMSPADRRYQEPSEASTPRLKNDTSKNVSKKGEFVEDGNKDKN